MSVEQQKPRAAATTLGRAWGNHRPATITTSLAVLLLSFSTGCDSDRDTLRQIQVRQQRRVEASNTVDHLRETHALFSRLGESDLEAASRQINYHLNAWREQHAPQEVAAPRELLASWRPLLPTDQAVKQISLREFQSQDVRHFRLQYLLHRISNWVLDQPQFDPWLQQRLDSENLPDDQQYPLQVASRLFDWVIRNVQLQPLVLETPAPPAPKFPEGLEFRGAGYRQTSWETLWRGSGDAWQRADLFLQLCRHAGLDACLLALPDASGGEPQPWMCGVRLEDQIYLFDTRLGLPIPGPDEQGIATLEEARKDPSVLRRLKVPGVFDYPYTSEDVQQCVALLDATPELLSGRMRDLTAALTGDQRMNLFLDAAAVAERLDAVAGVAGVRLWHVPLQSRIYQQAIEDALRDNLMLNQWYFAQWGLYGEQTPLGQARWRHLEGQFDDNFEQGTQGARVLYMQLRRPEFELADLQLDVELQQQYNLRRQAGEEAQVYERRIAMMQEVLRSAKRTATFWLALMHVDEANWSSAEKWLDDRVLQDPQAGHWYPLARYNLARTEERLEDWQRAEQLYKTDGDPQEHGNRIRARLIGPTP